MKLYTEEQDKMHIDDGTIIEFLCGTNSYDGVWFGQKHPKLDGTYWWRAVLKAYFKEQILNQNK